MKKRKISKILLFLICLLFPAVSANAETLLGTPQKEIWLEKIWECLENYHFSRVPLKLEAKQTESVKPAEAEETESEEIENKEEKMQGNLDFTTTQYIFVGDSRVVGMNQAVQDAGCLWIGQVSAGLPWFRDSAAAQIDEIVTDGSVIILNMGVNDLGNVWGYISLLEEKIPQWTEKGAEVYYMSVNPVDDHPYISKEDIANFNNILYNNLPLETGWIETNSYLLENGYSTLDGVHFDTQTYQKIFEYTMEVLSGFGR